MQCYICSNTNLTNFLNLGNHPPPLNFVTKERLLDKNEAFPLQVFFCSNCGLVQLGDAVDPRIMFKEYLYTSGVSTAFRAHLESFTEMLVERFSPNKDDLVIDIASNDGTLLQFFKNSGSRVLGVEPSNIADIAMKNGIQTVNDFFNEGVAKQILDENGQAKIITITNAFAHIKDLDSLMNGIRILLKEDGVFVSESQYLVDIIEKLEYDTIYHEHLRYYSLKPLIQLFEKYDMDVFDCERISSHGGSIRVYASLKGKFTKSDNVKNIIDYEDQLKLSEIETYQEFGNKVYQIRKNVRKNIKKLRDKNNLIIGYGAPAKATTALNFFGISKEIDFIVEDNKLKHEKFIPGVKIPIKNKSYIKNKNNTLVVLAWNFYQDIKKNNDNLSDNFINIKDLESNN